MELTYTIFFVVGWEESAETEISYDDFSKVGPVELRHVKAFA
jgi:hypothetical protein